jgi:uncharacterized protein
MAKFFGDTYALIELLKGNPNYENYSRTDLVTTEFNILELTYALFRDFGRDEAANVINAMRIKVEVLPTDDLGYLNASDFRLSPTGPEGSSPLWMLSDIRIRQGSELSF